METETAIRNGLLLLSASMRQEVDAVQVRAYLHGLKTIAGDVVMEAAERLIREPGRKFFPTVPEWYGVCASVIDERRSKAAKLAEALQERCEVCQGTGMKNVGSGGLERMGRCKCFVEGLALMANAGQSLRQLTSGDDAET